MEELDEPDGRVASFVVRRVMAFVYCSAFLSLLGQVDGLFGCGGVYALPTKSVVPFFAGAGGRAEPLAILCTSGALLAGCFFIGMKSLDQWSGLVLFALWMLFSQITLMGGPILPAYEDKLLLETGLVAMLAASGGAGESAHTLGARRLGRLIASWSLCRIALTQSAQALGGGCGAWRSLTAARDSYQLQAFPLPTTWPLSQGPEIVGKAVTLLQLYHHLVVAPLLLAPWQSVAWPAAIWTLLASIGSMILFNGGVAGFCQLALVLALLDDDWHLGVWSPTLLKAWGCEPKPQTAMAALLENNEKAKAAAESDSDSSSGEEEDEDTGCFWVGLGLVACYLFLLLLLVMRGGSDATLADVLSPLRLGPIGWSQLHQSLAMLLAIAVALRLLQVLSVNSAKGSGKLMGVLMTLMALTLWFAGLVQLAADLGSGGAKNDVFDLASVSKTLAGLNLAHTFRDPHLPCPEGKGRADILIQGAVDLPAGMELHDAPPDLLRPLDLSSRFLPTSAERRPMWLQPYTPRLDRELWILAQRPPQDRKAVPAWLKRLCAALALRDGAAPRLAVGAWDGQESLIYGIPPESSLDRYSKMRPPLVVLQVLWMKSTFMEDKHAMKWWNVTTAAPLVRFEVDDLLAIHSKVQKKGECEAPSWRDLPLAEMLAALIFAASCWRLLLQTAGSKPNPKRRRK